ncbi:MAG: SGNH/GDSL hydrolase family protein [Deltaproteobacteria bacterium]|nr:SGNH/GDSL hydrolase family protein [Deltaproteobacteria bacterium]
MLRTLRLIAVLLALVADSSARAQDAVPCTTSDGGYPGQHVSTPNDWIYPVWSAACKSLPTPNAQLACATFNLEDWPRLSRYAAANACVPGAKAGETRVVFMGDSITDNWSSPRMGGFFPGKPYINRGISGQTTPQMLVRFRADVIAHKPQAVVILAGTNDIGGNTGPTTLQDIQNNLASMADLARANGIAVVLASLLPVSGEIKGADGKPLFSPSARRVNMNSQLNAWLKDFTRAHKYVFLDYAHALTDAQGNFDSRYTYDGLHPNAEGYAVMAPLAEQAIAVAIKSRKKMR